MSVILLDAEVTPIDGQVGTLTAAAALVGHTVNDPLDNSDGNPDSTQVWKDDGAEITLKFYNSVSPPNGFIYPVLFSPVLIVALSKPLSLRDALTLWVEPLRRIVSLSTGEQEAVTYLGAAVSSSGASHPFQVYGSRLMQNPFASDANVARRGYRSFQFGDAGLGLSPRNAPVLAGSARRSPSASRDWGPSWRTKTFMVAGVGSMGE